MQPAFSFGLPTGEILSVALKRSSLQVMWEVNLFRKRSVEHRTSTVDPCQANGARHSSQDRGDRR